MSDEDNSEIYIGLRASDYDTQLPSNQRMYEFNRAPLLNRPDLNEREEEWLRAPWFKTDLGNFRRDVCVAGHYLRIVLRAISGGTGHPLWTIALTALNGKDGHSVRSDRFPRTTFQEVITSRPSAFDAALAFFRLFSPGPAE